MYNPCGCNWNLGITCRLHLLEWQVSHAEKNRHDNREDLREQLEEQRKLFENRSK